MPVIPGVDVPPNGNAASIPRLVPGTGAVPNGNGQTTVPDLKPTANGGNGNGQSNGNGHGNGHAGTVADRPADAPDVGGRGHLLDPDGAREKTYQRQIDILERRIKKLAGLLEIREEEVRRLLEAPGEQGIASVYDRVQGIDEEGPRGELKRLLMSKIYEANLKLRERVSSPSESAE